MVSRCVLYKFHPGLHTCRGNMHATIFSTHSRAVCFVDGRRSYWGSQHSRYLPVAAIDKNGPGRTTKTSADRRANAEEDTTSTYLPYAHQGFPNRPFGPNRRPPVPVYRTGSTGSGRNRSNSNLNSKNSVQPVRTGLPAGLTGLNSNPNLKSHV